MARRSLVDQRYRANVHLPSHSRSKENPAIGRIARAAMPVLLDAAEIMIWPSDVTVREGLFMRFVESNRSMTPLHVNRNEIGDKADIVTTAAGRAHLAFCPEEEREQLIDQITDIYGEQVVIELSAILAETKELGYATRGDQHTGNSVKFPRRNDRLSAIALPVITNQNVECCVSLLWPRNITEEIGGMEYLSDHLKSVAQKIEERLTIPGTG